MNRTVFIGESSLRNSKRWIDAIAHNIANINTPAYRRHETIFSTALNTELKQGQLPDLVLGSGVKPRETSLSGKEGSLRATGQQLDLAIAGPAFFVLQHSSGEISFTRGGSFSVDGEGMLTASDGVRVLGADGEPINLGLEPGEITVAATGIVRRTGRQEPVGKLQLVCFDDPTELRPIGGQRYVETPDSGEAVSVSEVELDAGTVKQGFLEASNVELATELTELIVAERAFQFAARVVQEGDQLDGGAAEMAR